MASEYANTFGKALEFARALRELSGSHPTATDPLTAIYAATKAAKAPVFVPETPEEKKPNRFSGTGKFWDDVKKGLQIDDIIEEFSDKRSPGSRAIDIASRPLYTAGNILAVGNDAIDNDKFLDPSLIGDTAKAAFEGFTGKSKITAGRSVQEALPENTPGLVKGIAGFAADVALDPLTYVPGAAILKTTRGVRTGVSKTANKIAGAEVSVPREMSRAATAAQVGEKAAIQVEAEKAAEQASIDDLIKKMNIPAPVRELEKVKVPGFIKGVDAKPEVPSVFGNVEISPNVLANTRGLPVGKSNRPLPVSSTGVVEGRFTPPSRPIDLIAVQGTIDTLEKVARDIKPRLHSKDLKIDSLYRDIQSEVVEQTPTKVTGPKIFEREVVSGGPRVKTMQEAVNALRAVPKQKITGMGGLPTTIGRQFETIASKTAGAADKALARRTIETEAKKLLAAEAKRVPQKTTEKFTKTVTETVIKENRKMITESKRLSKAEQLLWVNKYADKLSKSEITYLRQAGNAKSFETRVASILEKRADEGFASWNDLMRAVDEGLVDEKDLANVMRVLNAKSIAGIKKNHKVLGNKFTKLMADYEKAIRQSRGAVESSAKGPAKIFTGSMTRIKGKAPEDQWTVGTPADVMKKETVLDEVQPAEKMLDNIAQQGAKLDIPKVELNADQINILKNVLPDAALKNLLRPQDWAFVSGKGARRSSATPGEGLARWLKTWNSHSQTDTFRIIKAVNDDLLKKGYKFKSLQREKYNQVMPMLEAIGNLLKRAGVEPVTSARGKGYPMTMHDVFAAIPRDALEHYMFIGNFKKNTTIFPTKIMEAADIVLDELLQKTDRIIPVGNSKKAIINAINTPSSKKDGVQKFSPVHYLADADAQIEAFADVMTSPEVMKNLAQTVENNYLRIGIDSGEKISSMTEAGLKAAIEALTNPQIPTSLASKSILEVDKIVRASGKETGASPETIDAALNVVKAEINKTVTGVEQHNIRLERELDQWPQKKSPQTNAKLAQSHIDEAERMVDNVYDLDNNLQAALDIGISRRLIPLAQKFNTHIGQWNLRQLVLNNTGAFNTEAHIARKAIAQIHNSAKELAGSNSDQLIQTAFRAMQHGDEVVENTPVARMVQEMAPMMDRVFDNVAARNGLDIGDLNKNLTLKGVPDEFLYNTKVSPTDQWKTWENVKDPLDLIDRYHAGLMKSIVDVEIGAQFSAKWGSKVAKPGWVKISNNSGRSHIYKYIDSDLYYPEELAKELHVMDSVMLSNAKEGPFSSKFIRDYYDPVIQLWKTLLTIYRPGHHSRNLVGDMTFAWMAGVNSPTPWYKAAKVMRDNKHLYEGLTGWDLLDSLGGVPKNILDSPVTIKHGKFGDLTSDQIRNEMHRRGLLLDYSTLEDTAFGDNSKKTVLNMLYRTKLHNQVAGFSQSRDHFVRYAHFIDKVEKSKARSLQAAFDDAARSVRKWHPDGSDLTKFEHDKMRRLFMFYSWTRKAIPLVAESIALSPGKTMVFPKAMYNTALAMGLDPESISNPFPDDQLFPKFLTDMVTGPIAKVAATGDQTHDRYWGINPGQPQADIVNDFGGPQGFRSIAGSLSPWFRVPVELGTGVNLGIGNKINDKSDYVDSQIPVVSNIANLLNRSISEPGAPQSNNVFYDARGRRHVDENAGIDVASFVNWLTGVGLNNQSKPNYIKRAEQEERGR